MRGYAHGSSRLGLKRPVIDNDESSTQAGRFSKVLRIRLLLTLAVDCLGALALAVGEFSMPLTIFATLAATIQLAIGVANGWAFNSVRRAAPTWARDAFIAQMFVLFLAGYIIVVDQRSAIRNWYVMATAGLVAGAAFLWLLLLAPKSRFEWTKPALVVTALFPLAGLLQFWLQNYYMPSTSLPLVDITTELSPQGWSGSIVHLSAKVTIHNRGSTRVNIANSLMRVTAYSKDPKELDTKIYWNKCAETPDRDEGWCRLARGIDPSGNSLDLDFRVNPTLPGLFTPTPPSGSQLVYVTTLQSDFLVPGETDIFQRDVDIDSGKVSLVRLSAAAITLTDRRIEDIRSCAEKHASAYADFSQFAQEVRQAQPSQDSRAPHYFCREFDIAPRNFIEKLIANHPAVEVTTWLNNPNDVGTEYPIITYRFGTAGQFNKPDPDRESERKLEELNPGSETTSESEYAPTEKPPPSPAPAPPSGKG